MDFHQLEIHQEQDSPTPKVPGGQDSQDGSLLVSLFTILSQPCLTVGLERIICLALGPISEAELGSGLYHLSRWFFCSKIPCHMSYTHPSDSSLCHLASGNESLHSPYLKGKPVPTTPSSSRYALPGPLVLSLLLATALVCMRREPQNPTQPGSHSRVPWSNTHKNIFSVSTTCIFNSLA